MEVIEKHKKTASFVVEVSLLERLEAAAREENRSRSNMLEQILRAHFEAGAGNGK